MSVCLTVYDIFSVKEWRDLEVETGGRGRSRSMEMGPFDRSYITFYWSAIVSVAVCCTIFKYGIVEFNVPLDTLQPYRSFRRRFYGSHDPTNSVIALKDDG